MTSSDDGGFVWIEVIAAAVAFALAMLVPIDHAKKFK
jgi:hypothetical protein